MSTYSSPFTKSVKVQDGCRSWPPNVTMINSHIHYYFQTTKHDQTDLNSDIYIFQINSQINSQNVGTHGLSDAIFKMSVPDNDEKPK